MRIMLATDGSAYSEAAVDELAARPVPIDSQVLVISVVELPSFPWAFPGGGVDFDQQMQQTARAAVEEAVRRLKEGPESRKMNITIEGSLRLTQAGHSGGSGCFRRRADYDRLARTRCLGSYVTWFGFSGRCSTRQVFGRDRA